MEKMSLLVELSLRLYFSVISLDLLVPSWFYICLVLGTDELL